MAAAGRSAQSCVNVTDPRLKKKREPLTQLWILSWWPVGGEEVGGDEAGGERGRGGGGYFMCPQCCKLLVTVRPVTAGSCCRRVCFVAA